VLPNSRIKNKARVVLSYNLSTWEVKAGGWQVRKKEGRKGGRKEGRKELKPIKIFTL
jgi:hypothetical protein